jgi:hypothetical protein
MNVSSLCILFNVVYNNTRIFVFQKVYLYRVHIWFRFDASAGLIGKQTMLEFNTSI